MSKETGSISRKIDVDEFLYKKQFQRQMNPLFIPFTKYGVQLFVMAYIVFGYFNGGTFMLLVFGLATAFIYKTQFSYRYYELEHLWVVTHFYNFLQKRRRRTLKIKPLLFSPDRKKKRIS